MQATNSNTGIFYVVATPIGNRDDITLRAIQVLQTVDLILAEDTRHSKRLLDYHLIATPTKSCHEHNERQIVDSVVEMLHQGKNIALISDAGTPLISDPGFNLVRALREYDIRLEAVPGPSSVMAALSVAGLPTDRFWFEGFLPSKSKARIARLEELSLFTATVVAFESSHRIVATLRDCSTAFTPERRLVMARELTKKFETVVQGNAVELLQFIERDPNQTKGEFVLLISGAQQSSVAPSSLDPRRVLQVLSKELSPKQAAALTAEITGMRKNEVYRLGLESN